MKALVKEKGIPGIWMADVPKPVIGPNDVLIKVKQVSICGTDIGIYNWNHWASKNVPIGTTIGHEFMGYVVEVGSQVSRCLVGDRVTAEGHITCGTCAMCQTNNRHLCPETRVFGIHNNGAFAEYIAVPQENIFHIPDYISDDFASIFDPFGNAVHTAYSAPLEGRDVLITGAGPIGMMAAAIARHKGARNIVITDINEYRLTIAKKMGATHTVNIDEINLSDILKDMDITFGMEMSGTANALTNLLDNVSNGGFIALLGLLKPNTIIDWDLVIFKMLTLKGIFGREIFKTWDQMADLIKKGLDLTPVITHRYSFGNFEEGFDAMTSGNSGKVILEL